MLLVWSNEGCRKSGFTEKLAKLMKPILKLIFKESAKDEKL